MGAFTNLKWKKYISPRVIDKALRSATAREFLVNTTANLSNLLSLTGVPSFAPGTTAKQKAIQMLKAAAEVEHQFIVQYLYASYCCGSGTAHAADLMTIAQEEMGHLLTVQNLLSMLQGQTPEDQPPYLERLRTITDDQEPSPFKLEPLSLAFIARFLVAESSGDPNALPPDIEKHLPSGLELAKIHRVGILYAGLYLLFQDPSSPIGPWTIPLGTDLSGLASLGHLDDSDFADPATVASALSVSTNWRAATDLGDPNENVLVLPKPDFTDKASMRKAALNAIHLIAGQGEGLVNQPGSSPEPSHAQRLHRIYDALVSSGQMTPASLGTDKFPTDPYTIKKTDTPAVEDALIDETTAATAANEFDRTYERLLLHIALSIASPNPAVRGTEATAAFGQMRLIDRGARNLVTLGRKIGGSNPPAKLAAPPFTFPSRGIPTAVPDIQQRLATL
jgi:hypothetical protein